MKKKIMIIGAGGHARSLIDIIESTKKFKIVGLVDNGLRKKKIFNKYKILGKDFQLSKLKKYSSLAIIGIGQIKDVKKRIFAYELLKKFNFKIPIICSPKSYISKYSSLEEGTVVFHGAIINSGACVGKNTIINTRAIIEHDVKIGNHCHVSTNATLNGGVVVGKNSFIGSNAVIKENIKIGNNCIIAANTFLKKNLANNQIYNPKI